MEEIRCGNCNRKLAEADYRRLAIKCPRCGVLNVMKAKSLTPDAIERQTERKDPMATRKKLLNNLNRPALRYFGGKWRIAPWIISHFPPHRVYVEPFGGGASVLLRKPPCPIEVYNDLDGDLVEFFTVLRDPVRCRRLVRLLKRTPYARDALVAAFRRARCPVERARRLAVRSMLAFHPRSVFGHSSTLNVRGHTSPARQWMSYARAVPTISARLRPVIIENKPALRVIADHDSPETLFYVGPPYVTKTRTSHDIYNHEMTDADHAELLSELGKLKGYVALSGYDNSLYSDHLPGWLKVTCAARVSNSRASRTEVLWLSPRAARALSKGPRKR